MERKLNTQAVWIRLAKIDSLLSEALKDLRELNGAEVGTPGDTICLNAAIDQVKAALADAGAAYTYVDSLVSDDN